MNYIIMNHEPSNHEPLTMNHYDKILPMLSLAPLSHQL